MKINLTVTGAVTVIFGFGILAFSSIGLVSGGFLLTIPYVFLFSIALLFVIGGIGQLLFFNTYKISFEQEITSINSSKEQLGINSTENLGDLIPREEEVFKWLVKELAENFGVLTLGQKEVIKWLVKELFTENLGDLIPRPREFIKLLAEKFLTMDQKLLDLERNFNEKQRLRSPEESPKLEEKDAELKNTFCPR